MSKPKTRKQIADEHGISTKTLNRRIKASNMKLPKGLLYETHQKLIEALLTQV